MWIRRHDGSLINIESFGEIAVIEVDQTYKVYAWRSSGSFSILATYKKEQQAEEAIIAIFSGMRKGDKAMTMPYCVTDYGEDI